MRNGRTRRLDPPSTDTRDAERRTHIIGTSRLASAETAEDAYRSSPACCGPVWCGDVPAPVDFGSDTRVALAAPAALVAPDSVATVRLDTRATIATYVDIVSRLATTHGWAIAVCAADAAFQAGGGQ